MGEAQTIPYEELLRRAREAFEGGSDLTVAVEEEFSLLDPETLSLVNRFEELKASAEGSAVDQHLVGELIASEVEVRTGRCEGFAEVAERMGERRAQLWALAEAAGPRARGDGHASVEPLAGPADHRHAALPPERRAAPLRGLAQQHVRPPRSRRDPRRRPGDRGAGRPASVPAAPARAVGELAARRGGELRAALGTHRDLHAHVPALRRARRLRGLGDVRGVRPAALRDRLDRRAHAALVERPPAPRLPDRRDPDLRRPARAGRGPCADRVRLRAHRADRFARWTRASRCPRRRRG